MIKIDNLWLYYLVGYIIALIVQEWANKKRGKPFDDPEFLFGDKKIVVIAMIWLFGGFAISLFVNVTFGILFFIGFAFYILGLIIGIAALYSFANNSDLVISGIHKYSRNPIYVSWIIFYFGLTLMGLSFSLWSILFVLYFIVTIPYFHWTILLEEEFLKKKYGEEYKQYLEKTPRYLRIKF